MMPLAEFVFDKLFFFVLNNIKLCRSFKLYNK